MSGIKRFLSDTIIYGFTTIVSRLLNFLLTPIFIDRLKATAEYGIFTYLYSWVAMINAVLAFGMETTYFRYLQKVDDKNCDKVFNNTFFVTIVTSLVFSCIVGTFAPSIALWLGQDGAQADYTYYVWFFTAILVADALAVVPFAKIRAAGRPIRYGVLKLCNIFIVVSCNVFFLYFLPDLMQTSAFWQGVAGSWFRPDWVLGNIFLANLIASVATLLLLLPELATFRLRPDMALIKNMIWYSFPIMIANISFIINEHLDKIMIPRLMPDETGLQDAGIYGAVAKIAVFLSLFVTAFRMGAEPFFFAYAKNENARKTYAAIMEYFVIMMVVVMVGISANIDWLKNFIRTEDPVQQELYWSGLFIIPVLLFNYVLLGIYMNLSIWYKLSDQTRYGLYISGIGAIITIVLNLILIPRYSYVGAAVCTTIVYLVMVGISYYWGQRNYPIPYPVRKIGLYLMVGILLCWFMFSVIGNHVWLSNAMLVCFLLLIAYKERSIILKLWSRK